MQIKKLDKFLCCLELEMGGTVLGWLGLVFSIICIIGIVVAYFADAIAGSNAFVVATGLIVFFGVVAFIKFLLIKGTAHANPTQIFPAVILEAVVLTFEMLACLGSLFYFELNSLLMYAFSAIVNSYCLICLYSLYEKTRSAANLRLANAQP